jgi:hypothetical protein
MNSLRKFSAPKLILLGIWNCYMEIRVDQNALNLIILHYNQIMFSGTESL